jgi:hypothetical protein
MAGFSYPGRSAPSPLIRGGDVRGSNHAGDPRGKFFSFIFLRKRV